jgi:hypothetical protein
MRERQRQLRQQAKNLTQDLRNAKKRRTRILARLRHLDTAGVLQVLGERGLDLEGLASLQPRREAQRREDMEVEAAPVDDHASSETLSLRGDAPDEHVEAEDAHTPECVEKDDVKLKDKKTDAEPSSEKWVLQDFSLEYVSMHWYET